MKTTQAKQRDAKISGARFSPVCEWQYSADAIEAANKIKPGTISDSVHKMGMESGEPLIIAMDALLQYAYAYKARFDGKLCDDNFLGPYWLDAIKNLRQLLNRDGAEAMRISTFRNGYSQDSKDNGAVEEMFWAAMDVAGYGQGDM